MHQKQYIIDWKVDINNQNIEKDNEGSRIDLMLFVCKTIINYTKVFSLNKLLNFILYLYN